MAEDQMRLNAAAGDDQVTRLPADPAIAELADHGRDDFLSVVRDYPASSLCWALLAEGALLAGSEEADIAGYAYALTGCHCGVEALRTVGWNDRGTIPWEHLTNQGFLRCVWARSVAADRIGQAEEAQRCVQFLRRVSEPAWQALHTTLVPTDPARTPDNAGASRDDGNQPTAAQAAGSTDARGNHDRARGVPGLPAL